MDLLRSSYIRQTSALSCGVVGSFFSFRVFTFFVVRRPLVMYFVSSLNSISHFTFVRASRARVESFCNVHHSREFYSFSLKHVRSRLLSRSCREFLQSAFTFQSRSAPPEWDCSFSIKSQSLNRSRSRLDINSISLNLVSISINHLVRAYSRAQVFGKVHSLFQ